MCSVVGGIITLAIGAALVIVSSVLTFVIVPGIIENLIINEMVLIDNTTQMERFEEIPFPLNFTIRVFNITNKEDVLNGGVPDVTEIGPYIYKLYQTRETESIEEDVISYKIRHRYEFDLESSYPNTEDDIVTIANLPYHIYRSQCHLLGSFVRINRDLIKYTPTISSKSVQPLAVWEEFSNTPIEKYLGFLELYEYTHL